MDKTWTKCRPEGCEMWVLLSPLKHELFEVSLPPSFTTAQELKEPISSVMRNRFHYQLTVDLPLFLVSLMKCSDRSVLKEGGSSELTVQGPIHHRRDVKVAGAGSSWLYCARNQQRARNACALPFSPPSSPTQYRMPC